jgi:hypothetical protein
LKFLRFILSQDLLQRIITGVQSGRWPGFAPPFPGWLGAGRRKPFGLD